MAVETELKFTVHDIELFDRIKALDEIAGYRIIDEGLHRIADTYFDTRDNFLLKGNVIFRLRAIDDKYWLTFKSHKASSGTAYQREEIESETTVNIEDIVAGNLPETPPVDALLQNVGVVSLIPSLRVENNRHVLLLVRKDISCYELVLDEVTFKGPRGNATVNEIEVESLLEKHIELESIGSWLKERFGLVLAGPSKYILGMKLVGNV